jgi:3-methylcrotonyl-CoA carboxylase alpha subunit
MRPGVLIANRGEIACRVIRTCHEMGLRAIAVYSEADRNAMHVHLADEAHEIGPPPVRESYLNIDRILEAARLSSARYVHPGYGLLSENADFARRVQAAGLRWVGPSPESIVAMGEKARARAIAEAAGVPVLKGSGPIMPSDGTDFDALGAEIGMPALIKAVAGGGGIGMRICTRPENLAKSVAAVSEMAERTFGNVAVIVERYIERARHVEVQLFGLGDGRCLILFDRDCSTQRRFQKVVEEAPAPTLPEHVRRAMAEAARGLASAQNYRGAGTVEFIVDVRTNEFFFLEMNTRLQVEHPVTEMITGLDIVAMQLRLEMDDDSEALAEVAPIPSGHAIECRIYAEDPNRRFYPSPGLISRFEMPRQTRHVRIDTGVSAGSAITPYYDPLIAKITCHGDTREAARDTLLAALSQIDIAGVATNVDFLVRFVGSAHFDDDALHTGMIEAFLKDGGMTDGAERQRRAHLEKECFDLRLA